MFLRCEECNSYEMYLSEEPTKEGAKREKRIVARCVKCYSKENYRVASGSVRSRIGQRKAFIHVGRGEEKAWEPRIEDDPHLATILKAITTSK